MLSTRARRRVLIGLAMILVNVVTESAFAAAIRHITSTADDGTSGTLRYEIARANAGDTVDFQLSDCPCTVTLASGAISLYLPITIIGPGSRQLSISGNNNDRIFYVAAKGTTITGLELRDGIQAGGGAIATFGDITLVDIAFRHNRSFGSVGEDTFVGNGGAVYVDPNVVATISQSVFEDNSAGPYGSAGAIDGEGSVQISGSAFVGNEGHMCGAVSLADSSKIENSTFVGNRTIGTGLGSGGAICTWTDDILVVNSTIAKNFADRRGGGITALMPFSMANTVVANNVAPIGADISGSIFSQGYNLVSNRSGSSGYHTSACADYGEFPADLPEQDPSLSPLHITIAGSLPVLSPNPESPLINAISIGGPCVGFDVPSRDARGITRPQGMKADIGAVEFIPDDDRVFCDAFESVTCAALH